MGRADRARRGDESRRLTCLPRRSGEAASPSRLLPSGRSGFLTRVAACLPGRAADSGPFAFAAPAAAPTGVDLTSNTRLASDGIVTKFKFDNARAFTAGVHSRGDKASSVDADMLDRVGTPVDTASSHSSAFSSRPGGVIPGTLTNPLTAFRKNDGFPGAVARWSIGECSDRRTCGTTGPWSQLSPLQAVHVRRRCHRYTEPGLRTLGRRRAGGPHRLAARPRGGWRPRPGGQFRRDTDGARERLAGGARRASQVELSVDEGLFAKPSSAPFRIHLCLELGASRIKCGSSWKKISHGRTSWPSSMRPEAGQLPRPVQILEGRS